MKKKRIHSCNVLEATPAGQRLWEFEVDEAEPKLEKTRTFGPAEELPPQEVNKDWHDLFQKKLNLAWIAPEQVYLRVVQLPKVDAAELNSMIEFQLEKLSPFPVAQILWGAEIIPSRQENAVTAVVCIVEREVVEEYLGQAEKRNYLADKVEVPFLNEILGGGNKGDGVWLYPEIGHAPGLWLAAWWSGGTLQHLQTVLVPAGDTELEQLHEQLMQTAWAGEVEGWLQMPLRWQVVAPAGMAAPLREKMLSWSELPIERTDPMPGDALASFSAARAAKEEPGVNLLPAEFAAKYRQQFIDRLWLRGIGAVVGLYLIGVVVYFIALSVLMFRSNQVEASVTGLAPAYTNVLKLKEQTMVMQDQLNLKFAALDSWKAISELLPPEFNLTWMIFGRGRTMEVQLHGTAPQGQENELIEYNEKLRSYIINGQPIFRSVSAPNSQTRPNSQTLTWQFTCELQRSEEAD